MGDTILKKKYLEKDVKEAAIERCMYLYRQYDKVIVNFSAGKDSTALLYAAIEAARRMNKLPVDAVFVDHEADGLFTIELCEDIRKMEEVDLTWYCVPFSCRNASSFNAPLWYSWHPAEKDLWVREMPSHAVTELEGLTFEYDKDYRHPDGEKYMALAVTKSNSFQQVVDLHRQKYERRGLTAISLVGIRAQESHARYTIMTRKKNECYISTADSIAYPIYDMMAKDVWKYIKELGLPYNKEYDLMNKGVNYNKLNKQRVGSIFGEESLRTLDHWREYYGEYWHKILNRAEGVKTAWRYCNKGIYSGTNPEKDPSVKWSEYCMTLLNAMNPKTRKLVKKSMSKVITWHKNQTDYPIAENEIDSCPLTGISWQFLARIVIRGDTKDRNLQKVTVLSSKARDRAGLTRDEAVNKYGKPEYIKRYYGKKKA